MPDNYAAYYPVSVTTLIVIYRIKRNRLFILDVWTSRCLHIHHQQVGCLQQAQFIHISNEQFS